LVVLVKPGVDPCRCVAPNSKHQLPMDVSTRSDSMRSTPFEYTHRSSRPSAFLSVNISSFFHTDTSINQEQIEFPLDDVNKKKETGGWIK
jgi:hypothetical protein